MIDIDKLYKSYGDIQALKGVDLHVKEGSIFGLLGVNGAGKSTLLSILNGLIPYDSGTISVEGHSLQEHLRYIRSISSLIPQTLAFYANLSVKENLDFFSDITPLSSSKKRLYKQRAIEINGLSEILNKRASNLSGGQKRRLNIAIGLLNAPKILYLDEPTVGIDVASRNGILDSIKQINQEGATIVYTSHYLHEMETICDDVAILHRGEILLHDSLKNLTRLDANEVVVEYGDGSMQKVEKVASLQACLEPFTSEDIKSIHLKKSDLERIFLDATKE